MVWEQSIESRIVEANIVHNPDRVAGQSPIEWRLTRSPTLMRISQESRKVGGLHYKKLFLACPAKAAGGDSESDF